MFTVRRQNRNKKQRTNKFFRNVSLFGHLKTIKIKSLTTKLTADEIRESCVWSSFEGMNIKIWHLSSTFKI